jgi:hypothetical protein
LRANNKKPCRTKQEKKKGGKHSTRIPREVNRISHFSLTDFVEQLKTPTAQTLETKWLAQNHYREDYQKKRRTKKNSDNIKKKTKKNSSNAKLTEEIGVSKPYKYRRKKK